MTDADSPASGPPDRRGLERALLGRVRNAFPALAIVATRLEESGGDHVLLIADERYVFRFPRPGQHGLGREIRTLELLRQSSDIPVPAYRYVAADARFAGYPLLAGAPLTPEHLSRLAPETGRDLLAGIVMVLRDLHGLRPAAVSALSIWPRSWTAAQFAARATSERLPVLAARLPALAGAMRRFFEAYGLDRTVRRTIVHGDFVPDHILIDEGAGRLAGIIDFGDVALGDPAQDLAGLWAYGSDAATHAVALYDPHRRDAGLLARSHDHFVRYRIDRLFEAFADDADRTASDEEAAELDTLLSHRPTAH